MHPVIPATLLAAAVCLVSDNLTSAGVPRRRDRWRFVSKRTAGDSGSQHLVEIVRKRLSRVPNGWISSLRNTNAFDCDLFLFNDSPGWPISTISLGTAPFYAVARSSSTDGNHRNKTGSRFLLRTKQDAIDPVSRSVIQSAVRGRKCLSYFLLLDFANLEPMANDPKLEILWGADSKKFLLLRDSNSSADDLDEDLGKPDFLRRHWKLKEPFHTYVVTVEEDGAVGRRYFELLWRCKFCSPRGEHEYRETHYQSGNRFKVPETFRGNFHGARLVLGTKEANPYVYVTGNDTDTGGVRFGGLVPGLVDLIGRKMNFSYEYVFSPDNKFGEGARDEEGELGGLLGMVYRREVDFTATAIPMDGPEHAFMDFSYPFHIGKLRLYTNAALDPPKWLQLWHVYSWGVAALTCSTALFAGFVTYLSDRLVPELDANGHAREYEESRWLLVLRMLFKTGAPEGAFPRTFVKRLAFMVLLLFTSLSEKIFSAALPGQFAFPEHGKEVQNFEQLDRLGVQIARVETDEHAHLSHVLSRFVSRPLVVLPDGTDLPELIRRNPFMYATPTMTDPFVVDIEDRYRAAQGGETPFHVIPHNIELHMLALTFPKHSPLLSPVDVALMELSEHGFYDRFQRFKLRDLRAHRNRVGLFANDSNGVVPCDFNRFLKTLADEYGPLNMDQLQGLFVVYALGVGMGTAAFFVELFRGRRERLRGDAGSVVESGVTDIFPLFEVVRRHRHGRLYALVLAWRVLRWWKEFPRFFHNRFELAVRVIRERIVPLVPVIRHRVLMDYSGLANQ